MLVEFRQRYPKGSLISELVQIDHGQYIVRFLVQVEGVTLAAALSISSNLEEAEDKAMKRALSLLNLNNTSSLPVTEEKVKSSKTSRITTPITVENKTFSTENGLEIKTTNLNSLEKATKTTENGQIPNISFNNLEKATKLPLEIVPSATESPSVGTIPTEKIDNSEMIALITFELNRIGWKTEQGREYLLATYGKKSRHMLTDEELVDFLEHLRNQPTA